jgi:hypothetical protein
MELTIADIHLAINTQIAILDRAYKDLSLKRDPSGDSRKGHEKPYPFRREAIAWFDSTENIIDEKGRFSFENICDNLDLDPSALRKYAYHVLKTGEHVSFINRKYPNSRQGGVEKYFCHISSLFELYISDHFWDLENSMTEWERIGNIQLNSAAKHIAVDDCW